MLAKLTTTHTWKCTAEVLKVTGHWRLYRCLTLFKNMCSNISTEVGNFEPWIRSPLLWFTFFFYNIYFKPVSTWHWATITNLWHCTHCQVSCTITILNSGTVLIMVIWVDLGHYISQILRNLQKEKEKTLTSSLSILNKLTLDRLQLWIFIQVTYCSFNVALMRWIN